MKGPLREALFDPTDDESHNPVPLPDDPDNGDQANKSVCRPNNQLSSDERLEKKQLKKKLKHQTKLRKLTIRLSQAEERRDGLLLEQTQEALDELYLEHPELRNVTAAPSRKQRLDPYPGYSTAKSVVESIHHRLNAALKEKESLPVDSQQRAQRKEFYTSQVRPLMKNMMKGTQTESLFDNSHALVAYTRHKFHERSMLVIDSLGKLVGHDSFSHFVESLTRVSCICSLGCGPGCDAVGALAFVNSLDGREPAFSDDTSVILLDWTIDQWREAILCELETILNPDYTEKLYLDRCDVRTGLVNESNVKASGLLVASGAISEAQAEPGAQTTLYLVSYVLSETRDKWQLFFDDLVHRTAPGGLFLLSDPTSWQLYLWLDRYRDCMEFIWLDSSMERPELQTLMRRFGPAVVLAMKRASP